MATVLREAQHHFGVAQWHMNVLLNLSSVPDHHPVARRANRVWEDLFSIVENLPKAGRTSSLINEEAPAIIPVKGKSVDQWSTSRGSKVADNEVLSPRLMVLAKAGKLKMPRTASKRRIMSKNEFLAALSVANNHTPTPMEAAGSV